MNMIKNFFVISLCIFLVACSDKAGITIPDTVLSKEKMAAVMVDIELLEASVNITGVGPGKIDVAGSSISLKIDVLKKHNITKKQFDDSFSFYANNPSVLSEVYELVLNDLSKMQAEASKKPLPSSPKTPHP